MDTITAILQTKSNMTEQINQVTGMELTSGRARIQI